MNRESERKRLVELINNYPCMSTAEDCFMESISDDLAAYLIDNGIVVPPYPIGERVFVVITNMPFVPDDVYECKIKAWMRYADKLSALVEIVEVGTFKGLAVSVDDTDLFTSMAAAQTILEVKKKKYEKMLKGEGA